jgi:hypothetical protein
VNVVALFYDYKQFFSIVVLAVARSNYRFIFVDIGSDGKRSYSSTFKTSALSKKIQENTLNISPRKPLDDTCGPSLPYVFGDEAFGLSMNLLRPYGGKNLSEKKIILSCRRCRARRFVSCTFGILSVKRRMLRWPLNMGTDLAEDIESVAYGYNFDHTLYVEGLVNILSSVPQQAG